MRRVSAIVEFYFDCGSPAAYLAHARLPDIARRTGAEVRPRPILLGGVFKASGNLPPGVIPAKGRYMLRDLERCERRRQGHAQVTIRNSDLRIASVSGSSAPSTMRGRKWRWKATTTSTVAASYSPVGESP